MLLLRLNFEVLFKKNFDKHKSVASFFSWNCFFIENIFFIHNTFYLSLRPSSIKRYLQKKGIGCDIRHCLIEIQTNIEVEWIRTKKLGFSRPCKKKPWVGLLPTTRYGQVTSF